jgi:hypothetical protein
MDPEEFIRLMIKNVLAFILVNPNTAEKLDNIKDFF